VNTQNALYTLKRALDTSKKFYTHSTEQKSHVYAQEKFLGNTREGIFGKSPVYTQKSPAKEPCIIHPKEVSWKYA